MGEVTPRRARPAVLPPSLIALVFAGGTLGTFIRASLESAFPTAHGAWPWATFWINLTGSLFLGFFLEAMALSGPVEGWRRRVRLTVGTGITGGYTTYSTFIVESDQLLRGGHGLVGAAYALVSVFLGVLLALCGIVLAQRVLRPGAKGLFS